MNEGLQVHLILVSPIVSNEACHEGGRQLRIRMMKRRSNIVMPLSSKALRFMYSWSWTLIGSGLTNLKLSKLVAYRIQSYLQFLWTSRLGSVSLNFSARLSQIFLAEGSLVTCLENNSEVELMSHVVTLGHEVLFFPFWCNSFSSWVDRSVMTGSCKSIQRSTFFSYRSRHTF